MVTDTRSPEWRLSYYLDMLDRRLEQGYMDDEQIVQLLSMAGLPVCRWASPGEAGYFSWEERHLYTDELRAWSKEHKRQRALSFFRCSSYLRV